MDAGDIAILVLAYAYPPGLSAMSRLCDPATADLRRRYEKFFMFDSHATQVRWIPTFQRDVTDDAFGRFARLAAPRPCGSAGRSRSRHVTTSRNGWR